MRRSGRVGSSVWSVLAVVLAAVALPGPARPPIAAAATPAGTVVAGVADPTNVSQLVNLTNRIASDTARNAYIATPDRIWKMDATTGALTSIVGTGEVGEMADGTPASMARITEPEALAVDSDGAVYFYQNYRIRKVVPGGTITTVAGIGLSGWGTESALAASTTILPVASIAIDSSHNVYFSQTSAGHVGVRKVSASTGVLTTVVGGGGAATSTCLGESGPATSVQLRDQAFQIAIDASNNLFLAPVCDLGFHSHVLKITGSTSSLFAGGGGGTPAPGATATNVVLPYLTDLGVSPATGDLYAVASGVSQIWRTTMAGVMYPVAGASGCHDLLDGTQATWVCTNQMAFAPGTALWITNWGELGKLSPTVFDRLSPDRHPADGVAATSVGLYALGDLAVRGDGEVYFAEGTTGYLRTVTTAGLLATKAGNGDSLSTPVFGGTATSSPIGMSQSSLDTDAAGNVYGILDSAYVAEVTTGGTLAKVAGTGDWFNGPDGTAATTPIAPRSIAVAADGTVFVLATNVVTCGMSRCNVGQTLRRIDLAGHLSTLWTSAASSWPYTGLAVALDGSVVLLTDTGDLGRWSPATGSITAIPFGGASGRLAVRVDERGDIYVVLAGGIVKVGPAGGAGTSVFSGPYVTFDVDRSGAVYVGQDGVIRKIPQVPDPPTDLAASRDGGSFTLAWSAPAWTGGVAPTYRVERSTDGGATWMGVAGTGSTTFSSGGLVDGTSYLFRVSAYNTAGYSATTPAVAPVDVPSGDALALLPPGLEVSDSTPAPAQSVTVDADGFAPHEWVAVVLQSTPTLIGTVQADAGGVVHASVTVPPGTPVGAHTLSLVGDSSGVGSRAAVTVVAADDHLTRPTPPAATFTAVTPQRLFETRPGESAGVVDVPRERVGGTNVLKVKVTGIAGVPSSGVSAVSLNVTAVTPLADGFVTVFPCGERPIAANVNYRAGEIVPNAVIAPVSASGEVCFYSMVDTYLVADVSGWFAAGAGFDAVTPQRLFETRPGETVGAVSVTTQRYGGDANVLRVNVTGVAGVPSSGVAAVSLNVTAVSPVGDGFVTVYPCGTRPPTASVNYRAGEIVPNAVIAPVSASGEVCFYSLVDTYLVADVNGWFATGSGFSAVTPQRLFETRPGEAAGVIPVTAQRYGGDANVLKIDVASVVGVAPAGLAAVSLNVTAVSPVGDGFVTVYPCGARPPTASVNYTAGDIVPNAVIAPVSASGEVCFFSLVDTFLIADINGWFATTAAY